MKKLNVSKESVRIVVCLGVIALVASLLLAVVNLFTQVDEAAELRKAIGEAYAEAEIASEVDLKDFENTDGTEVLNVFVATDGAYIILTHVAKADKVGYNAEGVSMLVIIRDDEIIKLSGYSHSETPGLGANAFKDKHLDQYIGLTTDRFDVYEGEQIVAPDGGYFTPVKVTSATYTTNAVFLAVNASVRAYVILTGGM